MTGPSAKSQTPDLKRHLFYKTSHSPSLIDLVGYERAQHIVDFCFIANPYYPTPEMLRDLQDRLPQLIKSYPSSNPLLSQKYLADVLHVNPENLLIGNGATELITLIDETLIRNLAIPVPTFGEYIEKLKDQRAAAFYTLTPENNYQLDLEAYAAWIESRRLKSALLINPGNPTGQLHPVEEVLGFIEKAKGLELIVIDESFIDFAGTPIPSLLRRAEAFPNLLIVRSMSKHCGVPGLRLGYCYTVNQNLLQRLRHSLPTWNVNTVAEYFLSQLPATDSAYQEARLRLIADVQWLYGALKTVPGLRVYPTGANFVLIRIETGRTAAEIQRRLLEDFQMYVRDCSNKVGMDAFHIRVASQGKSKDELLVKALKSLMAEA